MLKTKNTLIILTLLALTLGPTAFAQDTVPSIYYNGVITEDPGTYTFTYTVISRAPTITKWQLKSPFFEKLDIQIHVIAQDNIQDSQQFEPSYLHSPIFGTLEFDHLFDHKFNENLVRNYNITVYTNDYTGIAINEIEYQIQWPQNDPITGNIFGPVETEEIIEPPPWYTDILPLIIPLGIVIISLIAWRQKWI